MSDTLKLRAISTLTYSTSPTGTPIPAGAEYDCPRALAEAHIRAGLAELAAVPSLKPAAAAAGADKAAK